MKRKTPLCAVAFVCLFAGLALLLYAPAAKQIFEQEAEKAIRTYEKRVQNAPQTDWEELYQRIVRYNQALHESRQSNMVDPFSYEQIDFSLRQFGFEEEIIGFLSIAQMDVRLPIYLGANRENMRLGAVHLTQTSLPVGGINSNAVIAAHRGMQTAAMFRDIHKLRLGDEISVTNFRETLIYRVAEIAVIHPTDVEKILIQDGRDLVTLLTCHPYRKNNQRYVVYCERI